MLSDKKDMLWNGIPAIWHNKKYIIFSPYSQSLIGLSEQEIYSPKSFDILSKERFFDSPKNISEEALHLTLYMTSNCNLKCIYCFDSAPDSACMYGKTELMTEEFAIKTIKNIMENFQEFAPGIATPKLEIHFFGGEPTLNFPVIKRVVEYLEQKGVNTTYNITTNLIAPKEKMKYLIQKKFRFDISCDGSPEIQDKQRPFKNHTTLKSSSYVEENIKLLMENKVSTRTKVVVTQNSIEDMPSAVEYLANLGLDHIRLEPVLLDGRAKNDRGIETEKFIEYFLKASDKAVEIGKKTGKVIYVSNMITKNLFEPKEYFCEIIRGNRLFIMPNGKIIKCVRNLHETKENPFVIGNISEGKICIDKDKMHFLQRLSSNNIKECNNCFAKYICSGGCFNENYSQSKDFLIPPKEKCDFARSLIRELIIRMYEKLCVS